MINPNVLNGMSAKARGYLEAAMKLAEALRMKEEAELELAHLDGVKVKKSKHKARAGGRVAMPPKPKKASPSKIVPEDLLKILKKGPLTSSKLAKKARCSDSHVRKLLDGNKDVMRVGAGNRVQWALEGTVIADESKLNRRSTLANRTVRKHKKGFIDPTTKFDEVLKAVKACDGWGSQLALQDKSGISINVLKRTLHAMKRAGLVKTEDKAHNPAHKDSAKNYDKTMTYWVVA